MPKVFEKCINLINFTIKIFVVLLIIFFVGKFIIKGIGEKIILNFCVDVNELGLKHMEEKYGEKFTYHSPTGNSLSGTRQFFATCESLREKKVLVQIDNFREYKKVYSDNYWAVKYQEETIEFFRDSALEYFDDVRIFYKPTEAGEVINLPANCSFEEFINGAENEFIIMMEIKKSDLLLEETKEQIESIAQKIMSKCKFSTLSVIVMDENRYGTLNRKELGECLVLKKCFTAATIYIENNEMRIDWK